MKKKKAIVRAIQLYPQVAPILKGFSKDLPGNPRIECDQPNILEQILKIAEIGAACSDRRRDNTVRTVRTLDQLKLEPDKLGFQVSRSVQVQLWLYEWNCHKFFSESLFCCV